MRLTIFALLVALSCVAHAQDSAPSKVSANSDLQCSILRSGTKTLSPSSFSAFADPLKAS
jgi:hypothetical protein